MIDKNRIIELFLHLNSSKLDYLLLRNIDDELPSNLKKGKDIDLLVQKIDLDKWIKFLTSINFKIVQHPLKNDVFLYETDPFVFLKQKESGIIIDLNFQLCVRSLDKGQWIPLDQSVQDSSWKNKRFDRVTNDFTYATLGYNDEFITHIARSVFDKKEFQKGYIKRIIELLSKIDLDDVEQKMNLIFFKYTPFLLDQIKKHEFDSILSNYLAFKDY